MSLTEYFNVFVIQFYFAYGKTKLKDGLGVCKNEDGTDLKCCTDYRQKNDICVPCEVGTFGDSCTGGPCPYGFYGFGCLRKCNCTTDQYCDRRTGCVYNTTKNTENASEEVQSHNTGVIAVSMAAMLSVVFILIVIVFLYNIRSKFIRRYLTRLGPNRLENEETNPHESVEAQEDYSQMTRDSNNYNIISFNRRFNVLSRVNATYEKDVYNHVATGTSSDIDMSQDSYVSLALRKSQANNSLGLSKNIYDKEKDMSVSTSGGSRECYSLALAIDPNNLSEFTRKNEECT